MRIKYAGGSVIGAEEDAARALSAAAEASDPRETLCVLATYTAMLEVRKAVLDSRVARAGSTAFSSFTTSAAVQSPSPILASSRR